MPLLVTISCIVLGYTYVGYPLSIALLARMWPSPIRYDYSYQPTVTVLLAVHDGGATLERKLESLVGLDYPQRLLQILVYLDGCRDDSGPIARRMARRYPNIELMGGCRRLGKPTALNQMVSRATGKVLLLTDVRQPLAYDALRPLVAALADPKVGCASGHLLLRGFTGAGLYWKYETWIRQNESRFQSTVGCTGPLYVIRRELFEELPANTILDDVWLPAAALRRGLRSVYVTAAIATDQAFADEREFHRKARTLAGNYQLLTQLPWLLVPWRNPLWLQLISHKLLRLLSPWVLVTLTLATLSSLSPSPSSGIIALAVAQAGFYGMALFGARLGRPGKAAKSFVVMNVAAAVGLFRFAAGSQKVTW